MGRGPSYPFVDLEEAIGVTGKVYEYTKGSAVPTKSVVEHALGYSPKSSGGIKTIAALRSYGLIEGVSQTLKISDRAYRILMNLPESAERKQAIKDAALTPKWYQTCFNRWGPEPPARSTLIVSYGFVPTTVDGFLKGYKKTMEYAQLAIGSGQTSVPDPNGSNQASNQFKVGDYLQRKSQGELIAAEPPDDPDYPVDRINPPNIFVPAIMKPLVQGGARIQTETFALPEGVTGQFQWPSTMSAEAYEDFVYQLEGLKRRVGRAVRKEPVETTLQQPSE